MKTINYRYLFPFGVVVLSLIMGAGCLSRQAATTIVQQELTSASPVAITLPVDLTSDAPLAYPPQPLQPVSSPAYPPPGRVQITYSVPTPSAIPPTIATITPAPNVIWVPLIDGYFNPSSSELLPVSPPPWESGIDQNALMRSYIRAVTELVNRVNGNAVAYVSQVQAWTSVDEEPIPAQIWFEMADMDGDGDEEIIASFPIIYEAQLNGPGTPLETYVMCGTSLCLGQVLLFEQLEGLYLPVYRFTRLQNTEWLRMPQLVTIRDLDDDGLSEITMTESWCGASVCGKDLTVSQWDGRHWRILDSGKCPTEFMADELIQNVQSEFHSLCPELGSDVVEDEIN